MNLAYKHLDAKLRIAELSVGQWIGMLIGFAVGIAWGVYASPFGPTLTLVSAIYIGAVPAGAALLGNLTEVSPWLMLTSAVRWSRREGRYLPGPGQAARGYVVADAHPDDARPRVDGASAADLASLWSASR